ncbi:MAG TPA: DUF4115 domain-containing protein [Burkholderiaceae bacterium]|nr:DUF4115 domain-containing protein [Burkholderiaceae bacterium]
MANETITSVQDLVAAREARGLSTEDVQRQLKLHPRQVRAIEEGDWAALPGTPFVRGTLRNYGKLIEADVSPLLEAVSGASQPAELRRSSSLEEPLYASGMFGFGNGGSGHPWIWMSLLVVGIVALALYFGRDGDVSKIPSWLSSPSVKPAGDAGSAASGEQSAPGRRSEPVAIPSLPSSGAPSTETRPSGGSADPAAGSAGAPAAQSPAPAAAGGTAASAASPAAGPSPASPAAPAAAEAGNVERVSLAPEAAAGETVPLRITFDGESWIEIRSGAGKVLYTGTPKSGQTTIYATKGPISLTVARPEKVRIEYDGKPVQLKVAQGASIGRLRLPAQ